MPKFLCTASMNRKMAPKHTTLFFFFFFLIPGHLLLFMFINNIPTCSSLKPPFSCDESDPSTKTYTFCKSSLSITQRATDLVSRLTLPEKISQLVNEAPSIPRLGIPAYQWWSESLHGVADAGKGINFYVGDIRAATSFPQVILTAASFNVLHWYQVGRAIGTEARAIYGAGQATGMTFWAPNINVFRDPRWGRGQETPGEDPRVNGKYAIAYVRGVQGDSMDGAGKSTSGVGAGVDLLASACCKHFTAYDLDNWKGITRFVFNAIVSPQDLADTYQPPFQSCVQQGRASGIMCSYNQVNGVPPCANPDLLTKTARGLWGFNGYITSDCDAVSIIHDAQGYAKTPEDAVADVLKAGMDVNCGNYLLNYTNSAFQQGKVKESDIDRALVNLFSVRMRLGLFQGDPNRLGGPSPKRNQVSPNQVCSLAHRNLALQVALDGIVLLKNSPKILPLSKSTSLAVFGPNAKNPKVLLGNYYGPPCMTETPFEAIQQYVPQALFSSSGCDTVACNSSGLSDAIAVAMSVEYVVLFMGLDQTQEQEELDRVSLLLPGNQQMYIESVARVAKNPVVLVLLCGGPVDISFAKINPKISAIIWAGYPGQAGGSAIAQVIFGGHNPGGRLPITWYPEEFTKVPMTDMRMRPDPTSGYPGRTYRFYNGEEVFEFGYGLSYSNYSYDFASTTDTISFAAAGLEPTATTNSLYYDVSELQIQACQSMKVSTSIGVTNHGELDGRHPVLLFSKKKTLSAGGPKKQLLGFESVHLKAGERRVVEFVVEPCEHLSRTLEDGNKILEIGSHLLLVGDQEFLLNIVP